MKNNLRKPGQGRNDISKSEATMPKERPIIFNTEMVGAILDGKKTQTRRVVKPQPEHGHNYVHGYILESTNRERKRGDVHFGDNPNFLEGNSCYRRCPYGQPGDRLWVRETWQAVSPDERYRPLDECHIIYKASDEHPGFCARTYEEHMGFSDTGRDICYPWRPSIHMPKKHARIWLEITGIRVERLKDISPEDGITEGVEHWSIFPSLWDSINKKKHPWSSNPWVWVIEFKKA